MDNNLVKAKGDKRVVISASYADGKYRRFQRYNDASARRFGQVDKIYNYSSEDIDIDFKEANADIFSIQRGSGLWLWKPYLIDKTLSKMNEGDFLIYTDAAVAFLRDINGLIDKLIISNQDIMLFDLPFIESQWTNPSVLESLNANIPAITLSNQRNGAIILLKKNASTSAFVKKWLALCCDIKLLQGSNKVPDKNSLFINHREDQSILSVLSKEEGIDSFTDPTDYGKNPFPYIHYNILFRVPKKSDTYTIDKTYFLHYRGYNIVAYFFKYKILGFLAKNLFKIK